MTNTVLQPIAAVIAPTEIGNQPFAAETATVFRCVSKHVFDALAALSDDDFGITDLAPKAGTL